MADPPRVLVTGSRDWTDKGKLASVLWSWREIHKKQPVLVHGAARGVDLMAAELWEGWGLKTEPHPAKWSLHSWADPAVISGLVPHWHCPDWHAGRRTCMKAGFRRNAEMVALGADVCLAFVMPCSRPSCGQPKPHSSHGAWGCGQLALQAGIGVVWTKGAPYEERPL